MNNDNEIEARAAKIIGFNQKELNTHQLLLEEAKQKLLEIERNINNSLRNSRYFSGVGDVYFYAGGYYLSLAPAAKHITYWNSQYYIESDFTVAFSEKDEAINYIKDAFANYIVTDIPRIEHQKLMKAQEESESKIESIKLIIWQMLIIAIVVFYAVGFFGWLNK